MSWLIVDVRDGGLDGYYTSREDAERLCEGWKKRLGHEDVIVAEVQDNGPGIGNCFLSDRAAREAIEAESTHETETPATGASHPRSRAMNLENNPTIAQLAAMLTECIDEDHHHIVWVDTDGDVHLTSLPDDMTPLGYERSQPTMRVRFETLQAGKDWVGPDAAADEKWVEELFRGLMNGWRDAKRLPPGMVNYLG